MTAILLSPRHTAGASVESQEKGWRLSLPDGEKGKYHLAQLDDYAAHRRDHFPHRPPFSLSLWARLSAEKLPGTWGFGLWNDPFGLSLGFGGRPWQLPTLPNAIWFFYASEENYLSLNGEKRDRFSEEFPAISPPANGFFAGLFCSPPWPSILMIPALVGAPLLFFRPLARLLRKIAGRIVRQVGVALFASVTEWHHYAFRWEHRGCEFWVDERLLLRTGLSPRPPLGLVIWVDNQYASFTPDGRLGYGTLAHPAMWLEVADLRVA